MGFGCHAFISPPRTSAKQSRHLCSPITSRLQFFVKRNPSRLFRFARKHGKAFDRVCEKFGITELNKHQKEAITQIVQRKTDVFINLPTGFGKSLIYQALPLVCDTVRGTTGHIVVVSPLVNLMKDQVGKLVNIGIPAVTLSDISEDNMKAVERGAFSVVYGSPEAWLKNDRWRKMLASDLYRKKLCAIAVDEAHVVKQW